MTELKGCPLCGSRIVPSLGLDGVYQHAENVRECIIGDLGIINVAAWNLRQPWLPDAPTSAMITAMDAAMPRGGMSAAYFALRATLAKP